MDENQVAERDEHDWGHLALPTTAEQRLARLREDVREEPDLRQKWLDCTRLVDNPVTTTLVLVREVNRLEWVVDKQQEALDDLRQEVNRLDDRLWVLENP